MDRNYFSIDKPELIITSRNSVNVDMSGFTPLQKNIFAKILVNIKKLDDRSLLNLEKSLTEKPAKKVEFEKLTIDQLDKRVMKYRTLHNVILSDLGYMDLSNITFVDCKIIRCVIRSGSFYECEIYDSEFTLSTLTSCITHKVRTFNCST